MEWQPIETAPRGKELILYFPPTKNGRGEPSLAAWITVGVPGISHRKPTHWMALPEAPQGDK
jgi:hypothetical protein